MPEQPSSDLKNRIFRVKRKDKYVALSNDMLRDSRLSFQARGVLCYLLSRPADWRTTVHDLIEQSPAGKHIVYKVLRELEKFGYLKRVRLQRKDGTFYYETEVYEEPQAVENEPLTDFQQVEPLTDYPLTDYPHTENPLTENRYVEEVHIDEVLNNESTSLTNVREVRTSDAAKNSQNAPPKKSKPEFSPQAIESVYQAYPRHVAKAKAVAAIAQAARRIANGRDKPDWLAGECWPPPDVLGWLQERAARFAASDKGNAGEYTPHPATWFNQARYSDDESEWTEKRIEKAGNETHQQRNGSREQFKPAVVANNAAALRRFVAERRERAERLGQTKQLEHGEQPGRALTTG